MCGTETLAMVVSSTTMKLASARQTPAISSAGPVSGTGTSACGRAGPACAHRPARVSTSRVHRQAHAQRVRLQLGGIQLDAHGQALHHLDPVARGVLGGDQGEGRAGAAREAGHPAVELHALAVEVARSAPPAGRDAPSQLHLLEVGVHVDAAHGHDRHQLRADLDALADLHLAPGDHAVEGRAQHGARRGRAWPGRAWPWRSAPRGWSRRWCSAPAPDWPGAGPRPPCGWPRPGRAPPGRR